MLDEFNSLFSKVQGALKSGKDIVKSAKADLIDLDDLSEVPNQLISKCFRMSKPTKPLELVARREATDFVLSHKRMNDLFKHDRHYYYERGLEEMDMNIKRNDKLRSTLFKYVREVGE